MDQQFQDAFPAASKFLQTCEVLTSDIKVESFAIVLFGGTGDLSKRMLLPSLYNLKKDGRLPEDFVILAFGLPKMSDEQFRNFARKSLETFSRESFKTSIWEEFSPHLFHISSDFNSDEGYINLYNRIGETCRSTPCCSTFCSARYCYKDRRTQILRRRFCAENYHGEALWERQGLGIRAQSDCARRV